MTGRVRMLLKLFVRTGALALLAACGTNPTQLHSATAPDKLLKAGKGAGLLVIGRDNQQCRTSTVIVGRQTVKGFEPHQTISGRAIATPQGIRTNYKIMQLELVAGTYHIIAWRCATGRYNQEIGSSRRPIFGFAPIYRRSYASFAISTGEIVNLGYLHMKQSSDGKRLEFDVQDLPPVVHAHLQNRMSGNYGRMIFRPMELMPFPGRTAPAPAAHTEPAPVIAKQD